LFLFFYDKIAKDKKKNGVQGHSNLLLS